jgi:hypothetical protein
LVGWRVVRPIAFYRACCEMGVAVVWVTGWVFEYWVWRILIGGLIVIRRFCCLRT